MKIVFMGTPDFAVTILKQLVKEHEVIMAFTQPDSYVGRKRVLTYTPVKEFCLENQIKCYQPEKLNEHRDLILNEEVDLIVTAAYGQFVGMKILNHPKYGCINVHGSLLPKHRGGAPIQRAIINGDSKTGITIMYMARQMDAGDIISQKEIDILDSDNQKTMFEKLANLGSSMINEVIENIRTGNINPIKQNEEEATFSYNLTKEDELITFSNARSSFNQIRGLNPNPGAYFTIRCNDEVLKYKVYNSKVSGLKSNKTPLTITNVTKSSFDVVCVDNTLLTIEELVPSGKKLMGVRDYLNGQGKNIIKEGQKVN